jgi:hypothetical protein
MRRSKTSPDSMSRSPPPSIALTTAGSNRTEADEQSIQDQLSLFHFGTKSSGRRFSHPNQIKYVEEYERKKGLSQPCSPSGSLHPDDDAEFDYDAEHVNRFLNDGKNENVVDSCMESGRKTPTITVNE